MESSSSKLFPPVDLGVLGAVRCRNSGSRTIRSRGTDASVRATLDERRRSREDEIEDFEERDEGTREMAWAVRGENPGKSSLLRGRGLSEDRERGGCGGSRESCGSCGLSGPDFPTNPCGLPRYRPPRVTGSCCPSTTTTTTAARFCPPEPPDRRSSCCPCGACGGAACGSQDAGRGGRRAEDEAGGCCANAPRRKQPCKCRCQSCSGVRPPGGCGGRSCGGIYSCAGSGGGSCCFPRNTRRRAGPECCAGTGPNCGGCC